MSNLGRVQFSEIWWLFKHECKLFFYDLVGRNSISSSVKQSLIRKLFFPVVMYLSMHFLAWAVMSDLTFDSQSLSVSDNLIALFVLILISILMFCIGISKSSQALYDRGDFELISSSPIAAPTLFSIRLVSVSIGTMSAFLFGLTPIIHVGLLLGQVKWLNVYWMVFAIGLLASSISMLATLGSVSLIGVRKTRSLSQILSILIAGVFICLLVLSQAKSEAYNQEAQKILILLNQGVFIKSENIVFLPVRAFYGKMYHSLTILFLSLVFFVVTIKFASSSFISGMQESRGVGDKYRSSRRKPPLTFRNGIFVNIFFKEWRLIVRDDRVLKVIALYIFVAIISISMFDQINALLAVAVSLQYTATALVSLLISIAICSEEAPDLILSLPIKIEEVIKFKILSIVLPILTLLSPLNFWLLTKDFVFGLLMLLVELVALTSVTITHILIKQNSAGLSEKRNGHPTLAEAIFELVNILGWPCAVYLGGNYGRIGLIPISIIIISWVVLFFSTRKNRYLLGITRM